MCPECRSPIDRIFRYGRAIRLIELRALERKHLASVQRALALITDAMKASAALKKTDTILKLILQSPMRIIYEASGGSKSGLEVPLPPAGPLIQCLQMQGKLYASKVSRKAAVSAYGEQKNGKVFANAEKCFLAAIKVAVDSQSRRSSV